MEYQLAGDNQIVGGPGGPCYRCGECERTFESKAFVEAHLDQGTIQFLAIKEWPQLAIFNLRVVNIYKLWMPFCLPIHVLLFGRGDGKVVSVFAFLSGNPSLNPAVNKLSVQRKDKEMKI